MKETTKMSRVNGMLEKMFRLLNTDWFNNELPEPIITVVPTGGAYGHYTLANVWKNKDKEQREINMSSLTLDRDIDEIVKTMVHEMCHYYNDVIKRIQDCSRGGTYHNKHFKECAEAHGLYTVYDKRYGYSECHCTDEMLNWIMDHSDTLINVLINRSPLGISTSGRNGGISRRIKGASSSTHSIKYQCPCCGNSCRATKSIRVMCLDCMYEMIEC